MIRVSKETHRALWGVVAVIIAAGWAAFGIAGNGNRVFLAVMVVLTIILFPLAALLVRQTDRTV